MIPQILGTNEQLYALFPRTRLIKASRRDLSEWNNTGDRRQISHFLAVPQFELLYSSMFSDYLRRVLAGGIRSLQGAIPGPIPRPSLALVAHKFLQPPPL